MTNEVQGHYFIKFNNQLGLEKTEEDKENEVKWVKTFNTKEDLQQVLNLCKSPEPPMKPFVKLLLKFNRINNLVLKVRRTENLKVFCKDLFLPLVVFSAGFKIRNISDVAFKIFMIIISLSFDVIGFPIRLVTLIPSIFAERLETQLKEKAKKNHPLHQYLIKQKEINPKLM